MFASTEPSPLSVMDRVRLFPTFLWTILDQVQQKRGIDLRVHDGAEPPPPPATAGGRWHRLFRRVQNLFAFLRRMLAWDTEQLCRCCHHLRACHASGQMEVVLYGEGRVAEMLRRCAPIAKVKIAAVCPWGLPAPRLDQSIWQWPETALVNWPGPIVIATFVNSQRHVDRLISLGVPRDKMIVLE